MRNIGKIRLWPSAARVALLTLLLAATPPRPIVAQPLLNPKFPSLVSGRLAAAPSTTVSEEEILQVIDSFFANPLPPGDRLQKIIEFAGNSPKVDIVIDPVVAPWMDEQLPKLTGGVLLGSYIAGNLQAQLQSNQRQDNPVAGLVRVIEVYQKILAVNPKHTSPAVEKLMVLHQQGGLADYVSQGRAKLHSEPPHGK